MKAQIHGLNKMSTLLSQLMEIPQLLSTQMAMFILHIPIMVVQRCFTPPMLQDQDLSQRL